MLTVLLYFGVNYDEKCGSPFMPQNKKQKIDFLSHNSDFFCSIFIFLNFKYKIKMIFYVKM